MNRLAEGTRYMFEHEKALEIDVFTFAVFVLFAVFCLVCFQILIRSK